MLDNLKVSVQFLTGSPRQVADLARTTIGLEDGDKVVSESYMRKMYLCRHSPIRAEMYEIKIDNIPYCIGMHFARHKIGVEHFFQTQRDDRTGIDRSERKQTDEVMYKMVLNADAILTISHARLCKCADKNTIKVWQKVLKELEKINPTLVRCCVPKCIYQGFCYEHKSCNYHKTPRFRHELNHYREGINGYGEVEANK